MAIVSEAHAQVLVIGAGPSGLFAAAALGAFAGAVR
jgi:cation diffusion facilitator CzcD-associated flavoprotein CzcO